MIHLFLLSLILVKFEQFNFDFENALYSLDNFAMIVDVYIEF